MPRSPSARILNKTVTLYKRLASGQYATSGTSYAAAVEPIRPDRVALMGWDVEKTHMQVMTGTSTGAVKDDRFGYADAAGNQRYVRVVRGEYDGGSRGAVFYAEGVDYGADDREVGL